MKSSKFDRAWPYIRKLPNIYGGGVSLELISIQPVHISCGSETGVSREISKNRS